MDWEQRCGSVTKIDRFRQTPAELHRFGRTRCSCLLRSAGADRNLRLANDKAQDVSVKRLTRRNPTMAQKFAELQDQDSDSA